MNDDIILPPILFATGYNARAHVFGPLAELFLAKMLCVDHSVSRAKPGPPVA